MTVYELVDKDDAPAFSRDLLTNMGDATPDLIYAKDTQSRMIFANRAVLETLGKTWAVNRRANGTPFGAISASNWDPPFRAGMKVARQSG